ARSTRTAASARSAPSGTSCPGGDGMIRIDDADRVRTITLDRPEKLNAFNEPLYAAAAAAFVDAAHDPAVAVVVLTRKGPAFSAGVDIADLAAHAAGAAAGADSNFPKFVQAVAAFPTPLVCALTGRPVVIRATG